MNLSKSIEMKMDMCNNVADFHNNCQSCESYSPIYGVCRHTGDCFPVKCPRYLHIIGQKRRPLRIDKQEAKALFVEKKTDVKQLKLF